MERLDLDDLPPRIAAQLASLADGEALLIVQHGAVVGRLIAAPTTGEAPAPAVDPEQSLREIAEDFRAAMEDGF